LHFLQSILFRVLPLKLMKEFSFSPTIISTRLLRSTSLFLLNSMHHGAVTANRLLQNTQVLLELLPKMIHHFSLLKLTRPSKRRSQKNSKLKDSQLSSGSITEKPLTTKEEEQLMISSHGFSRKPDQHP